MAASLLITIDQNGGGIKQTISMDGDETPDEIVHLCHLLAFSDLILNERKPKVGGPFLICFTFDWRQTFRKILGKHVENYAKLRRETMAEKKALQDQVEKEKSRL